MSTKWYLNSKHHGVVLFDRLWRWILMCCAHNNRRTSLIYYRNACYYNFILGLQVLERSSFSGWWLAFEWLALLQAHNSNDPQQSLIEKKFLLVLHYCSLVR